MSEMERLHNSMRDGFKTVFEKLDILQAKQISNQKDIEYIKKEMNGKLDERIDNKILKFKFKTLIAMVTGTIGCIIGIITIIKFFVG